MKILQLHSDFIQYKVIKKEIAYAEEAKKKEEKFKNILVLFTCVEKNDNQKTAKEAIDEVKDFLKKVKLNKILIYPYAHLSSELAKPSDALEILKFMEDYAKSLGIEVYRTPFGWNKQFSIRTKSHPLAEQFKVFYPGKKEKVSEALKTEEKIKSFWFILTPNEELIPVEKFDFSNYKNLEKFAKYEISKSRVVQQIPPHVTLMKKLGIADHEPGSDQGNLRWYPKGRLIKSLIEEWVTQNVINYGGMEVETPIMYDFHHPALSDYLNRFPARQYIVTSDDREFFLRFSACFGQFLMAKDFQISYKNLPLRIYELTRYSFRREKSGELVGLRRLRAFTMPDVHAICKDLEQAKEEMIKRFELSTSVLSGIGLEKEDYELGIRFTKEFYEKNKEFVHSIVKKFGKPALIEMWEGKFFYFVMKWEFNFIDNLEKASALSTDQIDVENGKRYGIKFTDEDGKKKYPIILHCSPSGAVERCIYALLEKAYKKEKEGKIPSFPLWLSPIQVRIIPVSDKYLSDALKLSEIIEKNKIRVDVDDRNESVERKIRDAELEWIPYIIVFGEKEIKSKKVSVRKREEGKIEEMEVNSLINEIKERIEKMPFRPLPLSKLVSQRPQLS